MNLRISSLDWKVVLFAVLSCYALPWLAVGTFTSALISETSRTDGLRALVPAALALIYFVAAPIAAGYFTARYARNRPQLHVLLVATAGWLLSLSFLSGTATGRALYLLGSLALASLGAFLFMRSHRGDA